MPRLKVGVISLAKSVTISTGLISQKAMLALEMEVMELGLRLTMTQLRVII